MNCPNDMSVEVCEVMMSDNSVIPLRLNETVNYISCNSCSESPYHSTSDPEEGEDMTEEITGWFKSTHQKVILVTGVAGVSLGLLIMAFS